MKHSIRGLIPTVDGALIILATINKYFLYNLKVANSMTAAGEDAFEFEAWVNTDEEKVALFDDLKPFVDRWGGSIEYHACTHDEAFHLPCVITETYTRE